MFINYRTEGIFLKKTDRGEADQLFTVYTKDFGKLEILGKAIRKISSKLRSGAEIFYLSEIEFIQGKTHKTLTDAILIDRFNNIRNDLKKIRIAYKISETLDNLVKGQEFDEKIWQLLLDTFGKLNTIVIKKPWQCYYRNQGMGYKIYYYFFWNLLSILGYRPELYHCATCQKRLLPEKLFFSSKEGGVICQNCSKSLESAIEIKPETIKILRIILKKDWQILSKLKIEKVHLVSLDKVTKDYLRNTPR